MLERIYTRIFTQSVVVTLWCAYSVACGNANLLLTLVAIIWKGQGKISVPSSRKYIGQTTYVEIAPQKNIRPKIRL